MDFYCGQLSLAIEIDGGIHSMPARIERDGIRQQIIEEHGVRFLRVSDEDVEQRLDDVLGLILAHRTLTPDPSPAPAGEGN